MSAVIGEQSDELKRRSYIRLESRRCFGHTHAHVGN